MSITTTYKCDRCGNEQITPKQFWTIVVAVNEGTLSPSSFHMSIGNKIHVCRPCLEELGIYDNRCEKEKAETPPPPTVVHLVQQIMEIVKEGNNADEPV